VECAVSGCYGSGVGVRTLVANQLLLLPLLHVIIISFSLSLPLSLPLKLGPWPLTFFYTSSRFPINAYTSAYIYHGSSEIHQSSRNLVAGRPCLLVWCIPCNCSYYRSPPHPRCPCSWTRCHGKEEACYLHQFSAMQTKAIVNPQVHSQAIPQAQEQTFFYDPFQQPQTCFYSPFIWKWRARQARSCLA
jgi:hypothetical protein